MHPFKIKKKELCRLAGIDQVIKGNKMSSITRRVAFGIYPKYELITSHSMRKSFATNYFGKIETILMDITGHSRESTFLSYIGENPNKDAVSGVFMEHLRRLGNVSG
jgi:integrase